jgi:hypothetical protein
MHNFRGILPKVQFPWLLHGCGSLLVCPLLTPGKKVTVYPFSLTGKVQPTQKAAPAPETQFNSKPEPPPSPAQPTPSKVKQLATGAIKPDSSDRSTPLSFATFSQQIACEFIEGSAIAPWLYQAAVQVVQDIEVAAGGEVSTPIHDALNWHYTRFPNQLRTTQYAALLLNEDGLTWQAKLSHPRIDLKKGKAIKYESVRGRGSTAFLPAIDVKTWAKVAQRNHLGGFLPQWVRDGIATRKTNLASHSNALLTGSELEICATRLKLLPALNCSPSSSPCRISPLNESQRLQTQFPIETSSFWQWVELLPVSITLTEGGKKALCLLSQGYVAIALYGVNGGYRRLLDGTRELIPDLERFCQPERRLRLAFDQDVNPKTRQRVAIALHRFGALLSQQGCEVSVAQWQADQGKGVDDLVAAHGIEAWAQAESEALPLQHWQLQQRLNNRLSYPTSVRLNTADLSTLKLDNLPESGIIAIDSGKGTGKTKLISKLVADSEKVLAGGHRIALMRNLSNRLGLDYKGDLDKAQGQFISGAGYTLRIGFCVDSLLWFDPNRFAGCDLILDEAVQVVRHLLTSSTCARDGKRPALLARLRELIQVSRRVIIADADLDNATLHYLQQLRDDNQPVFLIRNDYQAPGYEARFIVSPDRTMITGELLQAVGKLEQGKVLFVTTDSKATSFALSRLIQQQDSTQRVLVVNSKTTGGECEQAFMKNPDAELEHYDVIICSPSVATGVSIEAQGVIEQVYGVFVGVSSTDADMAQSLIRVREPVPRVIWCAKHGSNYSKVSPSFNPSEVKQHLRSLTTATVSLIRCSLREDLVEGWDWENDPHIHLYCQLAAQQNLSMHGLRAALLVRLRHEGHQVIVEDRESDPAIKLLLKQAKQELKQMDAEDLMNAEDLTYSEVLALEQQEGLSPEQHLAVAKFHFKEFYALESLNLKDILKDNEGRWRAELLNLETQLFPGLAIERTVKALEKQGTWKQGICPWDISNVELRRQLRSRLGLDELIAKLRSGWQWTKYDLVAYADQAKALAPQIKVALRLSIDKMSDTQIVHQLLSQLGIKLEHHWSRSVPAHEGEKLRVYQLNQEHWQSTWAVLERRAAKRVQVAPQDLGVGSTLHFEGDPPGGDPEQVLDVKQSELLSDECLTDLRAMIAMAGDDEVLLAVIRELFPRLVLEQVGLTVT